MLEKFLNRKVGVCVFNATQYPDYDKGVVTAVDDKFIELDGNLTIAIKYIVSIQAKD